MNRSCRNSGTKTPISNSSEVSHSFNWREYDTTPAAVTTCRRRRIRLSLHPAADQPNAERLPRDGMGRAHDGGAPGVSGEVGGPGYPVNPPTKSIKTAVQGDHTPTRYPRYPRSVTARPWYPPGGQVLKDLWRVPAERLQLISKLPAV